MSTSVKPDSKADPEEVESDEYDSGEDSEEADNQDEVDDDEEEVGAIHLVHTLLSHILQYGTALLVADVCSFIHFSTRTHTNTAQPK